MPSVKRSFSTAPATADVQRSIALAGDIVVVAFLDSTKIQFTLAGAEPVDYQGRAAVRFACPGACCAYSAAASPRRNPSGGRPAICRVPVPGSADQYEPARVLDISLGGLAVLATPRLFALSRDQVVGPCRLDLPELGQIDVSLRVRYLEAWPSEVGSRRCGCEFVDLGDGARRSLQRYLERLEATSRTGGDVRATLERTFAHKVKRGAGERPFSFVSFRRRQFGWPGDEGAYMSSQAREYCDPVPIHATVPTDSADVYSAAISSDGSSVQRSRTAESRWK